MAKLVLLLVCASLVYTASALKCYHCIKDDCNKEITAIQPVPCTATQGQTAACLKHVFIDPKTNKEATIRKCILTSASGDTCNAAEGKQVACEVCEKELCNSAPSLLFSRYGLLAAVMALFVPRLFLH